MDERMRVFLESLMEEPPERLRELEEEAKQGHVPIIGRQAWGVLRFVLRVHEPRRVLEVGTAVGYSALLMEDAARWDCRITTIEKVAKRIKEAKANFTKYGVRQGGDDAIRLLEGDADGVLRQLGSTGERFDLIFLDAAKGQYLHFLPLLEEVLEPGGMMVADNVLREGDVLESRYAVTRRDRTIHGRMREFLRVLTKGSGWETLVLPVGDGVTVSQWKGRGHGHE